MRRRVAIAPWAGALLLGWASVLWFASGTFGMSLLYADDRKHEIHVEVHRKNGALYASAHVLVDASVQVAWEVMTDYDHMVEFVPHLHESRIISKSSEATWRVFQRGVAKFGWFSRDWEVERQVVLDPRVSISSSVTRGSAKRMDTKATFTQDGSRVRIRYEVVTTPKFWVPPLIGTLLMKTQVVEQLRVLADEMMRRTNGGSQRTRSP